MIHNKNVNTIEKARIYGNNFLKGSSPTYLLDVEILLSYSIKKKKIFMYSDPQFLILPKHYKKFQRLLRLRKNKKPISYLVNSKEFYGRDFFVDKRVLIPRPETEGLIDIVKHQIAEKYFNNNKLKILDIGTGSGCIAITLLSELKDSVSVSAIDISAKALTVAKKNCSLLRPGRINFFKVDIFKANLLTNKTFDIIVSNPPYLNLEDMSKLAKDIKDYEPKLALYGGKNGLDYYIVLEDFLQKHLSPNGFAVFEINNIISKKIAGVFSKKNTCKLIKDTNNLDRFILLFRH